MTTAYSVPGQGLTISGLMLFLASTPYEVVDVEDFNQPGPARKHLRQINPLYQISALRPADGNIVTETTAITLMILNQRPDLAPTPRTSQRQQFRRLLIWLVANIYPTFTYVGYPERQAPAIVEQLVENYCQCRKSLYLWSEQQLAAGSQTLGSSVTLLDCYVMTVHNWGPRQTWFDGHTSKFAATAQAVCQ